MIKSVSGLLQDVPGHNTGGGGMGKIGVGLM